MTSDPIAPELRSRNLRTILLLAALFLLPLVASFVLYYGNLWRPSGSAAHGELIEPQRPLPRIALPRLDGAAADGDVFPRKWSLVYVGSGACDDACRRALLVMRQDWIALNEDMPRVQRVFLVTADCCDREFLEREHPGLILLDASVEAAGPLLGNFTAPEREHRIFIVDPLGNLMMQFDARQDPKGLLRDLERLLRLSHIG